MNIVILAAGRGTRMKSDLPKVLAKLGGKSLIEHVLDTLQKFSKNNTVVVVGYQKERVTEALGKYALKFAVQEQQLGTGHAVKQAVPQLDLNQPETLVLCGDVPLLSYETLRNLIDEQKKTRAKATVLTTALPDAGSYGRIVRGAQNEVLKIVEFKDANPAEKAIREINSGSYIFDTQALISALDQLKSNNAQKEYYLTDTLEIIRGQGQRISAFCTPNSNEVLGVNTEDDLKALEPLLAQK